MSAFPASNTEIAYTASLSISLAAMLGFVLSLLLERMRSSNPSDLAALFLIASASCDLVLLTMPAQDRLQGEKLKPVMIRFVIQGMLIILEHYGDSSPRQCPDDSNNSPRGPQGLLNRTFFLWINPILLRGYISMLSHDNMIPLASDINPRFTKTMMLQAWSHRGWSPQFCAWRR
jgi:hypothetical protein